MDRIDTAHAAGWRGRAADYLELTKPGITTLVVLSTGVGFYLAARGGPDWLRLAHTLLGTTLTASGAGALNQYLEREVDARMRRTRRRPLPSGRLAPGAALRFAGLLSATGLAYLALTTDPLTTTLVALSLLGYAFVYTPLKRRTSLATLVGAVPGALPILAGWTAGGGSLGPGGWALFGILFFWQFPHVLALGLLYREDYARGGLAVLGVRDPDGRAAAWQILNYGLALLPVSLLPTLLGLTGRVYFGGALALGLALFVTGALVAVQRTERRARRLFLASVVYPPVLFALMVADKVAA